MRWADYQSKDLEGGSRGLFWDTISARQRYHRCVNPLLYIWFQVWRM